jgi:hypothetical protein
MQDVPFSMQEELTESLRYFTYVLRSKGRHELCRLYLTFPRKGAWVTSALPREAQLTHFFEALGLCQKLEELCMPFTLVCGQLSRTVRHS